ncbi:MAG: fibronectin type III domain-containing protein, partial [Elusimicrobia bacterium]|nr:fibronectin type III domain-containing protein [Elusimicrobiota bacterium]
MRRPGTAEKRRLEGWLLQAGRRRVSLLGCTLLLAAGWGLAATFTGPGGSISPAGTDSGGRTGLYSETNNLSGSAGEILFSTMTSASDVLRSGLLEVRSYPGTVTSLSVVSETSSTLTASWPAPGYDGDQGAHQPGTVYRIQRETDPNAAFSFANAQIEISTSGSGPGEGQAALLSGLDPNTTYYLHLWTRDADGNLSYSSNRSTAPTLPVRVQNPEFKDVSAISVTLAWNVLPASPLTATAKGYRVEASSTNYGQLYPGGGIFSSATIGVSLSTLTVMGLEVDTTYYFRVGSIAHDGSANFLMFDSTKTLRANVPPSNVRAQEVFFSSVTMAWNPVNSDAGYRAEASTAPDFTGFVSSAATTSGSVGSLAIADLYTNTTYYLRVAALWQSATKYASAPSTPTLASAVSSFDYKSIFITSGTLTWVPLPLSPPDASSKTCQGYLVEASSTNFGALSPGGAVLSSQTRSVALSTLTLTLLSINTTYYFRAASLNWGDLRSYAGIPATTTLASPPGPLSPPITSVFVTSISAQWNAGTPSNPAGTQYFLRASSTNFQPGTVVVTSSTLNLADTVTGLLGNTTYYLRAETLNRGGIPAVTVLGATVTLAALPGSPAVSAVYPSSVALSWNTVASQGYLVEASSTNFQAGTVVATSQTSNGSLASLSPQGLNSNTTYYFRIGSLNWNSAVNFAAVGSTVTLAQALSGIQLVSVFETSGTVNWVKLPSSPQAAASEGYLLEASSTNFGALSPGGIALASSTPNVGLSTLSVVGLERNTTYYYRAGALNWASAANFLPGSSSATLAALPGSPGFSGIFTASASVFWTPVDSAGYELQASLSGSFGPIAAMSSTTAGGASGLSVAG